MTRHRFLVGLAVLLVSLYATTKAPAKDLNFDTGKNRNGKAVVFMDHQELLKMAKRLGLPVHRITVSKREKARLANLSSKGCGCALMPDDDDDFGSCFNRCLESWYINEATIIACGATCTAAGTGNPVGIALCAACLGVGEWIVAGCAMNCVWRSGGGGRIGDILSKNLKHRPSPSGPAQARNLKPRTGGARI